MMMFIIQFSTVAREVKAPFEIIRLYLEAGGKADKCIMSHLDRMFVCFFLNIHLFVSIFQ